MLRDFPHGYYVYLRVFYFTDKIKDNHYVLLIYNTEYFAFEALSKNIIFKWNMFLQTTIMWFTSFPEYNPLCFQIHGLS